MTRIAAAKKKYRVILADPAWKFKAWDKKRDGPPTSSDVVHYKTMTLEEMMALDVEAAAEKDCVLFMWVIDSHLDQALKLGAAWGFTYKTIAFGWKKLTKHGKDHVGMGHWTRKNIELCLLFSRGKPSRISKAVRQLIEAEQPIDDGWITARRRENSRKPDEQYGRIEALVGGPYLEMFARQSWPDWDVWGNETKKFDKPKFVDDFDDILGPVRAKVQADLADIFG